MCRLSLVDRLSVGVIAHTTAAVTCVADPSDIRRHFPRAPARRVDAMRHSKCD